MPIMYKNSFLCAFFDKFAAVKIRAKIQKVQDKAENKP